MMHKLTPKARALLAEQYEQLLFDESYNCAAIATVKKIINWCNEEDIQCGKWLIENKKYRFTRKGIEKIRDAYWSAHQENLFTDFSGDDRQSAAEKSADEKQAANKPTDHLILAALTYGSIFEVFQQTHYPTPQINLELIIDSIEVNSYDTLLMIENRDTFNDWYKFASQVNAELHNVLVIYRGDSQYAVAAARLRKKWLAEKPDSPVIYFGDFDLAGFRIAISGGFTHLLLLDRQNLEQHLLKKHYPFKQQQFLANIESDCPQGWRELLTLMTTTQAGLRQQWMYNTPLFLYKR